MTVLDHNDRRYHHDPAFHRMVDMMTIVMRELQLAPSEIREAAMYAVYREEMRCSPFRVDLSGALPFPLTDERLRIIAGDDGIYGKQPATPEEQRSMAVEIRAARSSAAGCRNR